MGKHLRHTHSGTPIQSSHPGCMWGILHILKYHHWHYVKKRLPHKRHGGGQHPGDDVKASNTENLQEHNNAQVDNYIIEERMPQSTPATKNSVKTRIKALITVEMSKKGRHHRSSTYPVRSQLTRTDSIHRLEPSYQDSLAEIILDDGDHRILDQSNAKPSASSSLDPPLLDSSSLTENCSGHNRADENGKQPTENDILFGEKLDDTKQVREQKLVHRCGLTMDASLYQSKEFLDALDLINMNKEFFLQILQDPGSSLARHFNKQQAFSAKMGLTKSGSFPLPDLSGRRGSGTFKLKHNQEGNESYAEDEGKLQVGSQVQKSLEPESTEDICKQSKPSITAQSREDGILKLNQAMAEIADISSSSSAHHLKNRGENQVVIKRFKDLKQKLKNAIKERKNERHRITMDAVLHKIPHVHGFSKDLKETVDRLKDPSMSRDGKDSPGSSCDSDRSVPSINKSEPYRIRRTSSLSESLDRYCQLYESSFSREAKHHISERLKLRTEEVALPHKNAPKSLGRILSLPDLKSYSYQSEDSSDAFSSGTPFRTVVDGIVSISSLDEQRSVDVPLASEYSSQLDTLVKSETQENLVDDSETYSVSGDQVGSASVANSEAELAEPSPTLVLDSNFQEDSTCPAEYPLSEDSELKLIHLFPDEPNSLANQQHESMDTPIAAKSGVNLEEVEVPSKQLNSESLHVQVDAKDNDKFNYVRDVLELSGFSGNGSLGTWHSYDQPVDPSLYEEVHGCLLLDPDCSGIEEGGNCNHLLLFDLINEVLMEIYERSYTYCPLLLSSFSHIRPMPVGYHVLEEVWANINGYLSSRPQVDRSLDYVVTKDLAKDDGWMNLQFDTECVGLELEELIFYDLLEEVYWT